MTKNGEGEQVRLETKICPLSSVRPNLLNDILEANCGGAGTGSGALAATMSGHLIYLSEIACKNREAAWVQARVSEQMAYANYWHEYLNKPSEPLEELAPHFVRVQVCRYYYCHSCCHHSWGVGSHSWSVHSLSS